MSLSEYSTSVSGFMSRARLYFTYLHIDIKVVLYVWQICVAVQDSLGRLADVNAIEVAQADTAAWKALPEEWASSFQERPYTLYQEIWTSTFGFEILKPIYLKNRVSASALLISQWCSVCFVGSGRQRSAMLRGSVAQLAATCACQVHLWGLG